MINTLFTSAALLATSVLVQGIGTANVVNMCDYDVTLVNVPAAGGGQNQIGPQTLSTGGSYSQEYTQLSNGDGWSLKLSKDASLSQVMQYEYTFHNDGVIWFDLSDVNGDPWGGDWGISATGDCTPKHTAYQFSTDDAYGMQSCPDTSAVTVTLCGSGGSAPPAGPPSGPPPGMPSGAPPASPPESMPPSAPTSIIPAVPSVPAVPSTPAAPASPSGWWNGPGGEKLATEDGKGTVSKQLSTFATSVGRAAHTVTNVNTVVVTHYVTVSPVPAAQAAKRHEHLHRHAHHHQHI